MEPIWIAEIAVGIALTAIGSYVAILRSQIGKNEERIEALESRFIEVATSIATVQVKIDNLDTNTRRLIDTTKNLNQQIYRAVKEYKNG